MEWNIMNIGCASGVGHGFGALVDGMYIVADDCEEQLQDLIMQLQTENRTCQFWRQLSSSKIIEKDLIPLLCYLENCPTIFKNGVILLTLLTQPLVTQNGSEGELHPHSHHQESFLLLAKSLCTNLTLVTSICREMKNIIEENGDGMISYEQCTTINYCLLLFRNILYIEEPDELQSEENGLHLQLMRYLFQSGLDDIILQLLSMPQREFWSLCIIQLVSLFYKNYLHYFPNHDEDFEDLDSSVFGDSEVGDDTCEDLITSGTQEMDSSGSPFHSESSISQPAGQNSVDSTLMESDVAGSGTDWFTYKLDEMGDNQLYRELEYSSSYQEDDFLTPINCSREGVSENGTSLRQSSFDSSLKSLDEDDIESCSNIKFYKERISTFTVRFTSKGFPCLAHIFMHIIASPCRVAVDEMYVLWAIGFFTKFARKNVSFSDIKPIFTSDLYGFLVFEAVKNNEELLVFRKDPYRRALILRRLHLAIIGLREMVRTLQYFKKENLEEHNKRYLDYLQCELAQMGDLRQCFLLLIRQYDPDVHNLMLLTDIIVTNHMCLLLWEEWITREFCSDKFSMLDHVKQFATNEVMQKYGMLLKNFYSNSPLVNDYIFTMMHHVAGDCEQSQCLMQVSILKMFIQLWESEHLTPDMADLIEYIVQKFTYLSENSSPEFLQSLFYEEVDCDSIEEDIDENKENKGEGEQDNSVGQQNTLNLSAEENEKLITWYLDLQDDPGMLKKILNRLKEDGFDRSEKEIQLALYELGLINDKKMESDGQEQDQQRAESKTEKVDEIGCVSQMTGSVSQKDEIGKISHLEEAEIIPFCISKMMDMGWGHHLRWVQNVLCEAAYVRLGPSQVGKVPIEEPVCKFFMLKKMSIPMVLYNSEQESLMKNQFFVCLLDFLGFHMEEDVKLLFPRIPNHWSVKQLLEKAEILGHVNEGQMKFDPSKVKENDLETTDVYREDYPLTKYSADEFKSNSRSCETREGNGTVTKLSWMNLINSYNGQSSGSNVSRDIKVC
ncbi:hypothetical protein CHS0354_009767 [Potamilus streckersoni]|uniref:Timeless n=1 Tax=Potamilus streckersoni TaxID=2493646 RepID=A0AAE0SV30_9BIVA|nr:hypothetical protein CHS0354_009767 [Potamilus streckersoni]